MLSVHLPDTVHIHKIMFRRPVNVTDFVRAIRFVRGELLRCCLLCASQGIRFVRQTTTDLWPSLCAAASLTSTNPRYSALLYRAFLSCIHGRDDFEQCVIQITVYIVRADASVELSHTGLSIRHIRIFVFNIFLMWIHRDDHRILHRRLL